MTLTVKLDRELERALARHCAQQGVSKIVVVRRALSEYLVKEAISAYDAGKNLFGCHGGGEGDLSVRRRERFVEIVDANRRRR